MKFLVAVDGSDEADSALAYATDIADAMDASVTAVHVVNPDVYQTGGSDAITSFADATDQFIVGSVEDAEERGQRILDEATALARELGHEIETALLYGSPVEAVTDYAEDEGVDAIYVGHRGRTERAELMVGSVAKTIVERATVPVTVVR